MTDIYVFIHFLCTAVGGPGCCRHLLWIENVWGRLESQTLTVMKWLIKLPCWATVHQWCLSCALFSIQKHFNKYKSQMIIANYSTRNTTMLSNIRLIFHKIMWQIISNIFGWLFLLHKTKIEKREHWVAHPLFMVLS